MVTADISLSAGGSTCGTCAGRRKKPGWTLHCVGWMGNRASRIAGMMWVMGCEGEEWNTLVEGKE